MSGLKLAREELKVVGRRIYSPREIYPQKLGSCKGSCPISVHLQCERQCFPMSKRGAILGRPLQAFFPCKMAKIGSLPLSRSSG